MEVKNSALCIFDRPAVQTDFVTNYTKSYFPINTLQTDGPLEFVIEGNSEEYIDVNDIKLYLQLKITKADGTDLAAGDSCALINLPIASLFRDVSLHLGTKQIEGGQMCYPYLGYFNTVMQFTPEAQASHMQSLGWFKDTAGKFEKFDGTNVGAKKRADLVALSKKFELMGPLFLNFFRQNQYLISSTSMRVKLLPSEPEFAMMGAAGMKLKIAFEEAILYVPRYKLNPSVINGHAEGLKRQNAIYPMHHAEVITFTIPSGQFSYTKDHLFPDQAPKLLLLSMVENEAFNGVITKNPFNFKHFDLNKLALYRDGCTVPGPPFQPNFAEKLYLRDYMNTMGVFKYNDTDDTNGMTPDEWANGFTIYAFDLTADKEAGASHRQPLTTKDMRLELAFAKKLGQSINVILYCVYDTEIEITDLRDIITHYGR